MRVRTSRYAAHPKLSRHRWPLLTSVAIVTGAIVLAAPSGYRELSPASLITPAYPATKRASPAGFADIVEKVKPAVVSVRVKVTNEHPSAGDGGQPPTERYFREFGMPKPPSGRPSNRSAVAQGSAFLISSDGYVVTNHHVVENAQTVEITMDDGKTHTARVIGSDQKADVALLKVDGESDFPYVQFGEAEPRVGEWVIAVGNPFGLGGTVTAGIVSARDREIGNGPYGDFIQIDAPVNKGNSGGPAFDASGNVIGMNTAIYSPSGGSIGIGFAIPAETVKSVVAQLKEQGSVTRGWIGVQTQTVTQDVAESLGLKRADGVLVAEPQTGGPAAEAGIASGDVIQSVEDQEIKGSRDFSKKIAAMKPGSTARLGILHNGAPNTLSVTVGKMQDDPSVQSRPIGGPSQTPAGLGLSLAPAEGHVGGQGVLVTGISPEGSAAEHGLRPGDVILDVSGKPVKTPAEVREAVDEAKYAGKRSVLLRVKSAERTHFVAVPAETG